MDNEVQLNNILSIKNVHEALQKLANFEPIDESQRSSLPRAVKKNSTGNATVSSPIPSHDTSNELKIISVGILEIFKQLSSIDAKIDAKVGDIRTTLENTQLELYEAKQEIADLKQCRDEQDLELHALREQMSKNKQKIDDLERISRNNSIILSGPIVKFNQNCTDLELLETVKTAIKNVYGFDLKQFDIGRVQRIGKDPNRPQILIALNSSFVKNAIMTKVIGTDKTHGIALNINEYLSSNNSNLLYELRRLRKQNPGKIYSSFSRHGRILYKLKKDSKPKILYSVEDLKKLIRDQNLTNQAQTEEAE